MHPHLISLGNMGLYKITPANLPQVQKRIAGGLITILLGGVIFIIIRGGVTESTSNVGQAYFCNDEFLNHSAINPDFSLLSSISKTTDFAQQFNFFDEKTGRLIWRIVCRHGRKWSFITHYQPSQCTDNSHGRFWRSIRRIIRRKYLMSVRIWSVWGKESFLYQLLRQRFPHRPRAQSVPSAVTRASPLFPSWNLRPKAVPCLRLPKTAGTRLRHGFPVWRWHQLHQHESYLLGSGYQQSDSRRGFQHGRTKNPWGVNDDITFEYLYRQIKERNTNQPWHTAFLTLSSHEPFEVPYHRLKEKIPNAFAFTDDCWENLSTKSRLFLNGKTCLSSACQTMVSIIQKKDWCTTRVSIIFRCCG